MIFIDCDAVITRNRCIINRIYNDIDRANIAAAMAVYKRVIKTICAVIIGYRRISKRTVSQQHNCAAADCRQSRRNDAQNIVVWIAVDAIAVIGKYIAGKDNIFIRCKIIVFRERIIIVRQIAQIKAAAVKENNFINPVM